VSPSAPLKVRSRLRNLVACFSKLERPLRFTGMALLGIYFAATLHSVLGSRFMGCRSNGSPAMRLFPSLPTPRSLIIRFTTSPHLAPAAVSARTRRGQARLVDRDAGRAPDGIRR